MACTDLHMEPACHFLQGLLEVQKSTMPFVSNIKVVSWCGNDIENIVYLASTIASQVTGRSLWLFYLEFCRSFSPNEHWKLCDFPFIISKAVWFYSVTVYVLPHTLFSVPHRTAYTRFVENMVVFWNPLLILFSCHLLVFGFLLWIPWFQGTLYSDMFSCYLYVVLITMRGDNFHSFQDLASVD